LLLRPYQARKSRLKISNGTLILIRISLSNVAYIWPLQTIQQRHCSTQYVSDDDYDDYDDDDDDDDDSFLARLHNLVEAVKVNLIRVFALFYSLWLFLGGYSGKDVIIFKILTYFRLLCNSSVIHHPITRCYTILNTSSTVKYTDVTTGLFYQPRMTISDDETVTYSEKTCPSADLSTTIMN
jgi:hypothetical protein